MGVYTYCSSKDSKEGDNKLWNQIQEKDLKGFMQVSRREGETDWVLGFKFVSERDEGMYECQVTNVLFEMCSKRAPLRCACLAYWWSTPQVTLANGKVKSRSVHLDVVTPEAIILSTDEYRIEKGALISLVCILENALLPPEYVFWYQNERMINYDTARGVTVTTMQGKKTSSRLNIQK